MSSQKPRYILLADKTCHELVLEIWDILDEAAPEFPVINLCGTRTMRRRSKMWNPAILAIYFAFSLIADPQIARAQSADLPTQHSSGKLQPLTVLGDTRFRHADTITKIIALKKTPRLLSSARDGSVRLWDIQSGRQLQHFRHAEDEVWNVALVNDETQFVSCGAKTIDLWDIASGKKLKSITPGGTVHRVCFLPGKQQLVTAGPGSKSQLWDLVSEKKIRTFRRHKEDVYGVDISRDGRWLVTSGDDNKICLFELKTGKFMGECGQHKSDVYTVVFGPDSQSIVACDSQGNVSCYWAENRKQKWSTKLPSDTTIVEWAPDGLSIGCTCDNGHLYLLHAATGKTLKKIKSPSEESWSLAFGKQDKEMFAGGDGQIQRFDLAQSSCLFPCLNRETRNGIPTSNNNVALGTTTGFVELAPDKFVFAATDPVFRIHTLNQPEPYLVSIQGWKQDWGKISHTDFHPTLRLAVVTTSDKIILCDYQSGKIVNTYPEKPTSEVNGSFATAKFVGNDRRVIVDTGQELRFIQFDQSVTTNTFSSFDFSTDLETIVPANKRFFVQNREESESIDFYDNRGRFIKGLRIANPAIAVATSSNGKYLSMIDAAGEITLLGPDSTPFATSPQPHQIDQWIKELHSDRYAIREAAETNLRRCGKSAIEQLEYKLPQDVEAMFRLERLRNTYDKSFIPTKRMGSLALKSSPQQVAISDDGQFWAAIVGKDELTQVIVGSLENGQMKVIGEANDLHSPKLIRFCEGSQRLLTGNHDGTMSLYRFSD